MYRGTEGEGDALTFSACWFYRIRAAQSAVRSPDYALRDVINFAAKFGLSYYFNVSLGHNYSRRKNDTLK